VHPEAAAHEPKRVIGCGLGNVRRPDGTLPVAHRFCAEIRKREQAGGQDAHGHQREHGTGQGQPAAIVVGSSRFHTRQGEAGRMPRAGAVKGASQPRPKGFRRLKNCRLHPKLCSSAKTRAFDQEIEGAVFHLYATGIKFRFGDTSTAPGAC
jgi:hypothetical protein